MYLNPQMYNRYTGYGHGKTHSYTDKGYGTGSGSNEFNNGCGSLYSDAGQGYRFGICQGGSDYAIYKSLPLELITLAEFKYYGL